jgi:hypothetical protein
MIPLFTDSFDVAASFVRTSHTFVFDVCSAVPLKYLGDMTSLSVWREEQGILAYAADSYGTLPQAYITQVGEHMLALVQALEPFASNEDALQLANVVMDGVGNVSLQPWKDFASASNCADPNDVEAVALLASGRDLGDYVLGNPQHQYEDDGLYDDNDVEEEGDDENETDTDKESAAFCNRWLDAVCSAVTGRLLERTMRIHHMSTKGCDHLAADYSYLMNVFSALGVSGHPHPLLNHVVEVVKMDPDHLQARILASETLNSPVVHNTEVRIALMRGIEIN